MAAPDPGWMPFVKIMFGFFILVVLAGLAAIIALGKVQRGEQFRLGTLSWAACSRCRADSQAGHFAIRNQARSSKSKRSKKKPY